MLNKALAVCEQCEGHEEPIVKHHHEKKEKWYQCSGTILFFRSALLLILAMLALMSLKAQKHQPVRPGRGIITIGIDDSTTMIEAIPELDYKQYHILKTSGSTKVITDYPKLFSDLIFLYNPEVKSYQAVRKHDRGGEYETFTIYFKLKAYDDIKEYLEHVK